jgi:hypothetical protein
MTIQQVSGTAAPAPDQRVVFEDPHAQAAGLSEAEVTRVRTLKGRMALAADRCSDARPSSCASISSSR